LNQLDKTVRIPVEDVLDWNTSLGEAFLLCLEQKTDFDKTFLRDKLIPKYKAVAKMQCRAEIQRHLGTDWLS
jgi:glycine cleavage system pyridoxal-binding protein P